MHNNFYFLKQLSKKLETHLTGFTLVSCFSQNKDELVIEFNNSVKSFFIKASLQPDFQCLSFPPSFHRARKNSVDLFSGLLMMKVNGVRQFANERSFAILLEKDHALAFALHGARANAILFEGDRVNQIFRNNFQNDLTLSLAGLDREIDWSYEYFARHQNDLQKVYFAFGKPTWDHLNTLHFDELEIKEKWRILNETRQQLEHPTYILGEKQGRIYFSLLPVSQPKKIFTDPILAVNEFFVLRNTTSSFQKEKLSLLSHVQGKLKQAKSYVEKNHQKLDELNKDAHYQQWGDLVMANLGKIRQGEEKIVVENFYDNQKPTEIKLKRELSPQKNAEVFYRKSRNQAIETKTLQDSLRRKQEEITVLSGWQTDIEMSTTIQELGKLSARILKQETSKEVKQSLPYHEFEFKGYKIWVGKNAVSNDKLTLKYSFKDDLWLHAKDVAGSHVLVKHQAGKPFPKNVIEHAASLAAYYSKRKNESLCPVAFTAKKNVRKRKGDPAGAVVVEREEVILVEPLKT